MVNTDVKVLHAEERSIEGTLHLVIELLAVEYYGIGY